MRNVVTAPVLLFLFFLIFLCCSPEEKAPMVAKVGKTPIVVDEFIDRYEFTPQLQQTTDKERNKRLFTMSLLGEKVLVEQGYRNGLHKTEKFKSYAGQMEKEAIIEKLFEDEITSKIEVTQEELKQAFIKSKRTLELEVLNFEKKEQAFRAQELIAAGNSLAQVRQILGTQDFISTDSVLTLSLKWGEAHPLIEDAAYGLRLNEVSGPIEVQNKYFILKLINVKQDKFLTETDFYQQIPSLQKMIRSRKSSEMFDDFLFSIMKDKRLQVSHEVFNFVAGELEKIYHVGENDTNLADTAPKDETFFRSGTLGDHLNDTFARFDDGSTWTIRDFIIKMTLGPFPLNYQSKDKFRKSLQLVIRRIAELESLAKKGRDQRLQKSFYVKYQTRMWSNAFIAQLMREQLADTVKVTEEEIRYHYDKHPRNYWRPEMLKLREILVNDETLAKQLHRRIRNGEDMAVLAKQYSKREISRENGGVSGFFTTEAWGEIGKASAQLRTGELGGPIRVADGQFSIFKVEEKLTAGPLPIDEIYDQVRSDVLSEKLDRVMDQYLAEFADDMDIEINHAVYDTVQISGNSMLVMKRHFPNRLAAPNVAPLFTYPQWQNRLDKILTK